LLLAASIGDDQVAVPFADETVRSWWCCEKRLMNWVVVDHVSVAVLCACQFETGVRMNLHTLTIPPQLHTRGEKEKRKIELLDYTSDFVARKEKKRVIFTAFCKRESAQKKGHESDSVAARAWHLWRRLQAREKRAIKKRRDLTMLRQLNESWRRDSKLKNLNSSSSY